jgi:hypothetical protein
MNPDEIELERRRRLEALQQMLRGQRAPADATSTRQPGPPRMPEATIRGLPAGTPMPREEDPGSWESLLKKAGRDTRTALDFTPAGDFLAAGDAGRELSRGNLGSAAISALAAAVPFAGVPKSFTEGLYSRLGRAIESSPFKRGTAEQWKAQLSKGVSGSEREWTGIDRLLEENAGRPLTSEQLSDVFNRGRIDLDEVRLEVTPQQEQKLNEERYWIESGEKAEFEKYRAGTNASQLEARLSELQLEDANDLRRSGYENASATAADRDRRWAERVTIGNELDDIRRAADTMGYRWSQPYREELSELADRFPRYEDYTQPGKKSNYREILLTLGEHKPNRAIERLMAQRDEFFALREGMSPLDWSPESHAELNAINNQLAAIDPGFFGGERRQFDDTFRSNHWDAGVENPLLHLRMSDRVSPAGERTLFVEEMQSDWHQRGRKEGYKPQNERMAAEFRAQRQALSDNAIAQNREMTPDERRQWEELGAKAFRLSGTGVPDAPFKKTGEWTELALKRALDEAARGDYDRIAFVTGEQAAKVMGVNDGPGGMQGFYDQIVPTVVRDYAKALREPMPLEPITGLQYDARPIGQRSTPLTNPSIRMTPELRRKILSGQRLLTPALLFGGAAASLADWQNQENY